MGINSKIKEGRRTRFPNLLPYNSVFKPLTVYQVTRRYFFLEWKRKLTTLTWQKKERIFFIPSKIVKEWPKAGLTTLGILLGIRVDV